MTPFVIRVTDTNSLHALNFSLCNEVVYCFLFCIAILTVASGADLDYETDKVVDVTIIAQDSVDAPGMMSSDVIITIYVQDVNDKEPMFLKTGYSESLFEDEDLNTIVFDEIEAEDVDTGLGGIVTYSITNSDPPASPPQFMIDETSGKLFITATYIIFHL